VSAVRIAVTVRGTVQGVGFRPWLHRRACALGLGGWAANSGDGLTMEVEGTADAVARLVAEVRQSPPPHARVKDIETHDAAPRGERAFSIRPSLVASATTADVPTDLATCADCLEELRDPGNRRHRYPFINCTQCGPRFTIVERLPYDRDATSMRAFALCGACRAEYEDPRDRRFHAEPIACPDCGPSLALLEAGRVSHTREAAFAAAVAALRAGAIVAVKGIGGFHLMVDARDDAAVRRLRQRKGREEKPFAVMYPDVESVRAACSVSALEAELLTSAAAPIVLLRRAGDALAPSVAPGHPYLGVMLPYSPLHHLLLDALGFPLVATSGNLGGEPIAFDDADAASRLSDVADAVLGHDRPILRPVDDSIVRVVAGRGRVLRRARGLAPAPIDACRALPEGIVALGGHLKTTCAVTRGSAVVVSPHLGDLDSAAARAGHARAVDDLARLHGVVPRRRVRDLHADYASARVDAAAVQHHLAHVAACVVDAGVELPVLGVAFDGGGAGGDGTVWGGEFLHVDAGAWRRVAALRTFRLPGGETAVREPRRAALGLLYAAFGARAFEMTDVASVASFEPRERRIVATMLERGVNAPLTSSVGRLFDAFASLAGLRQRTGYEGQAAAELEWTAGAAASVSPYRFDLCECLPVWRVDWQPALDAALADLAAGADTAAIARAFHDGLADAVVTVARRAGLVRVALTGGCFQNVRLTESTAAALEAAGFEPVLHQRIPPNDGGLALGQAMWAAWSEAGEGGAPCA
jgi:hydrogenase maturation protein HypF